MKLRKVNASIFLTYFWYPFFAGGNLLNFKGDDHMQRKRASMGVRKEKGDVCTRPFKKVLKFLFFFYFGKNVHLVCDSLTA